jgi:hypothetical protein
MEDIKEMTRRHEEEVRDLQNTCRHDKVSKWMPFMWAPGHFGADVKCCEFCGKIIERQGE